MEGTREGEERDGIISAMRGNYPQVRGLQCGRTGRGSRNANNTQVLFVVGDA